MELIRLIGFAAVGAVMSYTVRQFNPQAGQAIAVASGAFIMLSAIARLTGAEAMLSELASAWEMPAETLSVAAKAAGVAYLTRLTSSLCRDLGESSLAVSCEFAGRLMLILLVLPTLARVGTMLTELIAANI